MKHLTPFLRVLAAAILAAIVGLGCASVQARKPCAKMATKLCALQCAACLGSAYQQCRKTEAEAKAKASDATGKN